MPPLAGGLAGGLIATWGFGRWFENQRTERCTFSPRGRFRAPATVITMTVADCCCAVAVQPQATCIGIPRRAVGGAKWGSALRIAEASPRPAKVSRSLGARLMKYVGCLLYTSPS